MIICQEQRYLFIEIPLTASWAIHHELCKYYGGQPILHKHATYPEFEEYIGKQANNYFVFACVRNPLDEIVSRYFKLKSDHKGVFSNPESSDRLISDYVDQTKYAFVNNPSLNFEDYFRKFHRRPYGGLIDIQSNKFNYVIRYENLQAGFSEVLKRLKFEQVRPLPLENKTKGRTSDWQSYYTPAIRQQALQVCGPFMMKWGYEFPTGWEQPHLRKWNLIAYSMYTVLRNIYTTNFRYKNTWFSRNVRKFRAIFQ